MKLRKITGFDRRMKNGGSTALRLYEFLWYLCDPLRNKQLHHLQKRFAIWCRFGGNLTSCKSGTWSHCRRRLATEDKTCFRSCPNLEVTKTTLRNRFPLCVHTNSQPPQYNAGTGSFSRRCTRTRRHVELGLNCPLPKFLDQFNSRPRVAEPRESCQEGCTTPTLPPTTIVTVPIPPAWRFPTSVSTAWCSGDSRHCPSSSH